MNLMDNAYEGTRRIPFGEYARFVPVCVKCGRLVKADATIRFTYDGPPVDQANATCKKCGRTQMLFEGYY